MLAALVDDLRKERIRRGDGYTGEFKRNDSEKSRSLGRENAAGSG